MFFQHDNCEFSVPAVFRSKAQCEGNGRTLVEYCNAGAGHHRDALRVGLSRPTDSVAPLAKGVAIASETRLAVNLDKPTELTIIMLKEHLVFLVSNTENNFF